MPAEAASLTACWAFSLGTAGGFIAEFLRWFRLRDTLHKQLPDYAKSPIYWALTVVAALLGGFFAYLYVDAGIAVTKILALNIGAAAPVLMEGLVRQVPAVSPGTVD